ncbi:hypothetical protein DQ04_00261150 [Trypanosoma grayi]|uniref:hypothetical protein n=1 Tax=Trypanosoma grayi TaxID=71804 RepID=UPI0004F43A56|nr:hypothetical protein DQ04_00261150 [Trypanosoma grayi]KEG14916.1 hypothetical protein DQ04_00261150 [Trypanosoma grayi]
MQQEGFGAGASSANAAVPLLFHFGSALTPQSLHRARFYVNLLANPPPPPHPFGTFLEEAAQVRSASLAAVTSRNAAAPAEVAEGEGIAATARDDDAELPPLLEVLQQRYGHSPGSALHRMWVQNPQQYLSSMAQRIADLVTKRVLPLILGGRQEDRHVCLDASNNHTNTAGSAQVHASRYDIHVRFLPSHTPLAMMDAALTHAFCAEIVVRDVVALQRLEEAAELLRAQYTSVAAEGQTVQSALAFWRGVAMDTVVEDDSSPAADGATSAVVLGRSSDYAASRRFGCLAMETEAASWIQPSPSGRSRNAAGVAAINSSRQRQRAAPRAEVVEPPRALLQSRAGLVAVLYLAFNGALYTGTVCGARNEGISPLPKPKESAEPPPAPPPPPPAAAAAVVSPNQAGADADTGIKGVEDPVFYLPCAASTSFVRGLLGL